MTLFWTILGVVFAGLTFYYQFNKEPKKETSHLKEIVLVQFKMNQKLSFDLKSNLEKYASLTNSMDKLMLEGITFRQYINELDNSLNKGLSDEMYLTVKNMKTDNNHVFQSMYDSLKVQYKNLEMLQVESRFKLNSIG